MQSSDDLARLLRATAEHRHDPAALLRALQLTLLAADELVHPDDVGEIVRAVERALEPHERARIGEVRDLPLAVGHDRRDVEHDRVG